MHSDSHFSIGSGHNVCQDYAVSGQSSDGKAYAFVADGCSGSKDTDFGSRLIARAMQRELIVKSRFPVTNSEAPMGLGSRLFFTAAWHAYGMAESCGLDHSCLDSTLLCAIETENEGVRGVWAGAAGDGVIVARHRGSSEYDTHVIEFDSGFPAYPNYLVHTRRMMDYILGSDGGMAEITVTQSNTKTVEKLQHRFYPNPDSLAALHPYACFFGEDKYDLVMLMTDGALTFQQENISDTSKILFHVPLDVVIKEMMDFKSLNGEFVVRRAKKFLGKICADNKWSHYDDFSVAAVVMD